MCEFDPFAVYEEMSTDKEFQNKDTVERMGKKIEKIRRRINEATAAQSSPKPSDKENMPPARLDFSNIPTHHDLSPKNVNTNLKKRKTSTDSMGDNEDEYELPKPSASKKKKALSGSEKNRMKITIRAEFDEFRSSAQRVRWLFSPCVALSCLLIAFTHRTRAPFVPRY
jgi:hypothetical protein